MGIFLTFSCKQSIHDFNNFFWLKDRQLKRNLEPGLALDLQREHVFTMFMKKMYHGQLSADRPSIVFPASCPPIQIGQSETRLGNDHVTYDICSLRVEALNHSIGTWVVYSCVYLFGSEKVCKSCDEE